MPHIAPTAFSARWNTADVTGPQIGMSDQQQHQQQRQQQQPQPKQNQTQFRPDPTHSNIEIPSSPPLLPAAQASEGNGRTLYSGRDQLGGEPHRQQQQQQHMLSMSDEQPRTPLRRVSYPYPDSAPSSISVDRRHHLHQEGERGEHDVQAPHTGHQQRNRGYRPGGLTSSVVKGEAANSLLELVRGGNGHGNGNGNGHDGYSGYGTATSGGVGMCGL